MPDNKVCLINPPTIHPREIGLYFPMALLTLGGVLKAMGVPTELWDFDLYFKKKGNTTESQFRKLLRLGVQGSRASVFGISSIDSNFPMALWMAREIKSLKPGALVILGGPQPSSVPLQILERFEFVDAVVVGEGEATLSEMVDAGFRLSSLGGIPGVAFREEGKPCFHEKRALRPHLDEYPLPDYSLIEFRDYIAFGGNTFSPNVEVGRGCPFHCIFCSTSLMWEKDFRVKSPERILREMEFLHLNYGFTCFDFIHDNFTTSRKFVQEFCDFMLRNNRKGLTWGASSRTDCLDIPRLEKMHEAGLRGLFFGIETGSIRMQAEIKKNLDFTRFEPILRRGNELGINNTTAFILGFPQESREDMDQTVQRALHYKSLGTSRVFFSKLSPLPGTPIYRECVNLLQEVNYPSLTNREHYDLPYVQDLVRQHPDLFSSFYHVPHQTFSMTYIAHFTEFANLLVNACPQDAALLLPSFDGSASDLFASWEPWAAENDLPYYDYRSFTEEDFKPGFREFLNQVAFQNHRMEYREEKSVDQSVSFY